MRHQLSASDVEPWALADLLELADADGRRRWDELTLGYTESGGLPALREAIAGLYERVSPEDILVVAGAEEGIFLLTNALLGAGDEAIVVTPAYQSLVALPRSLGARVREVRLRAEDAWQLDLDALVAPAKHPRFVAINYPHNPTGALLTRDEQRRLVEFADASGAVLLSDEVYRGLEADPAARLPAAADLSPHAVSLGVMSKSFALPGLRIGWLASRNRDLLAHAARLKDYTTICSSAPSEILALIALRAHDRVLARSRALVAANREAAARFMAQHGRDVSWTPAVAGSTAFPRLARGSADDVARRLIEETSTLMVPGRVFDADAAHFRLGLGRRDLPQALANLGRVLST